MGLSLAATMDVPARASSPLRNCVGVDACRAGWFAARHDASTGRLRHTVFATFADLLAWAPAPAVIAIDIPIGLSNSAAKPLLGGRRGLSVFHTPVRQTLASLDLPAVDAYRHALATHRAVTGVGISKQAFYLLKKIAEVDAALAASAADASRVFEVHPEVAFAARRATLHGQPLTGIAESKHTQAGHDLRFALLPDVYRASAEQAIAERAGQASAYGRDDVLDAFICLWSALRIDSGVQVRLPAEDDGPDACLPRIHY